MKRLARAFLLATPLAACRAGCGGSCGTGGELAAGVGSAAASTADAPPLVTDAAANEGTAEDAAPPDAAARPAGAFHASPFARILAGNPIHPAVGIFPLGTRALVSRDAGFYGYAESAGPLVADGTLSAGLRDEDYLHPSFTVGTWPDRVVTLHGSFTGSGNPGNGRAYAYRGSSWTRIDHEKDWDPPAAAAMGRSAAYAFVPDPFYFINGLLLHDPTRSCDGKPRPLGVTILALDGAAASTRAISVDAGFFLDTLFTDGSGTAWAAGYSKCRNGVLVGSIEGSWVELEGVPGTETCTSREPKTGLPLVRARFFPAADGGIDALVYAAPGAGKPCPAAPELAHRDVHGTWHPRPLPMKRAPTVDLATAYVDAAGTAWLPTPKPSVLRIAADDQTDEVPLDAGCSSFTDSAGNRVGLAKDGPIARIVVPWPDDPWLVVAYEGGVQGLCRAVAR